MIERTSKNMLDIIGFYHEYEEHGCFSNWFPAEFDYAGKHYFNSEQFMMYQKVSMFRQYALAEEILMTRDPAACKSLGSTRFPEFRSDLWDKVSATIVKRGVYGKFQQNPQILEELLSTGNALLAECAPNDKIWGIGVDIRDKAGIRNVSRWSGQNKLGIILMQVREELRQEMHFAGSAGLRYIEASNLAPIPEWQRRAGELFHIPQFHQAVGAYSDTLCADSEREAFFRHAFCDWEDAMRFNMGGGLPIAGFYEMKQEIYDIVRRLNRFQ